MSRQNKSDVSRTFSGFKRFLSQGRNRGNYDPYATGPNKRGPLEVTGGGIQTGGNTASTSSSSKNPNKKTDSKVEEGKEQKGKTGGSILQKLFKSKNGSQ